MPAITSPHNEWAKQVRSLARKKERDATGQMLLEGLRLVEEAMTSGAELSCVLYDADLLQQPRTGDLLRRLEEAGVTCWSASASVIASCTETQTPQGIVAACLKPSTQPLMALVSSRHEAGLIPLIVALDGLRDPGNVGSILRTACGAGALAAVAGEGTADLHSPKVLRASMGAQFRIPICTEALPAALGRLSLAGYQVVLAAGEASLVYTDVDFSGPTVLVVGNEGAGVSEAVREVCDVGAFIPMARGLESLNAAASAAIFVYEVRRQQV